MIYLSRGYRNSDYLAIQPGGRGDVTASHIKWRAPGVASYVPSILQYDELLCTILCGGPEVLEMPPSGWKLT